VTITGTTPTLSDLLTATPADFDVTTIPEGKFTITYYEKVADETATDEGEDANAGEDAGEATDGEDAGEAEAATTYSYVKVDAPTAGKTYRVDVAVDACDVGNYSIAALAAAKTTGEEVPMTEEEAKNCVELTCQAAATTPSTPVTVVTPQATEDKEEEEPVEINSFVKGYADGTIRANNNITRAETAVIMARLSKEFDKDGTYTGSAPDVANTSSTKWYYAHVNYDIQKGIITGYADGNFRPTENITRAEFAAMLARFLGLDTTGTSTFDDVDGQYAWASGYIAALQQAGIVDGYAGTNDFKPGNDISRAEAIKMIVVALGLDTDAVTTQSETTVTVPSDLSTSHWAYKYIMTALSLDIADIAR
jgi:hypothetical protein